MEVGYPIFQKWRWSVIRFDYHPSLRSMCGLCCKIWQRMDTYMSQYLECLCAGIDRRSTKILTMWIQSFPGYLNNWIPRADASSHWTSRKYNDVCHIAEININISTSTSQHLRNRRHGIHHLFHLEAHLHLGRNDFFCALRIQWWILRIQGLSTNLYYI